MTRIADGAPLKFQVRPAVQIDRGIADEGVDPPPLCFGSDNKARQGVAVADIAGDPDCLETVLCQSGCNLIAVRLRAARNNHPRARTSQRTRRRKADALGRPGDNRNMPGKAEQIGKREFVHGRSLSLSFDPGRRLRPVPWPESG